MQKFSIEKLQALSIDQRHTLWQNAKTRASNNDDARALLELIESSGLDYGRNRRQSVSIDDHIGKKMREVIFSPIGEMAALSAQEAGSPPLAGLDPLLRERLGEDYSKENEATVQAGFLVTDLMKQLGFHKLEGTSKKLPSNCVARSGQMFARYKR